MSSKLLSRAAFLRGQIFQISRIPKVTSQLCTDYFRIRLTLRKGFCNKIGKTRDLGASDKIIGYWLLGCSGLVFGAVILGGITRLTESGLSMVRWHIIKGMKPPSCHEEWLKEFETYKLYPEYKFSKHNITLEEFKRIFYMEYLHRMWGRLIGVAFAVPAVYFLSRGRISKAMKPRLAIYFSLLVFQGLLGWHMVKSGLVEDNRTRSIPRVSQYRLMAHLGSAFLLYAGLFWSGLSYLIKPKQLSESPKLKALRILSHGNLGIIFTTVLAGAIVAGLDAGLVYNSFPKMAGKWIPEDIMAISPKWRNFTENSTTAQFTHRVLVRSNNSYKYFWFMVLCQAIDVTEASSSSDELLISYVWSAGFTGNYYAAVLCTNPVSSFPSSWLIAFIYECVMACVRTEKDEILNLFLYKSCSFYRRWMLIVAEI
ncbi:Cytochrome c oxidase assembly protein COX15-like protein [Trichoplax sp. H2]|nr:Cytochrome c oxidase assembly protein COX15-like protein [Trichoplax sp. H2]|eukprot:RDD38613.1 Cytochrome c oxidase assembly protein COX15-like protein [Trichoplax sp. H2]